MWACSVVAQGLRFLVVVEGLGLWFRVLGFESLRLRDSGFQLGRLQFRVWSL